MGGGRPWRKGGRRKAEVHERGDDLTDLIQISVPCSKVFTFLLLNITQVARERKGQIEDPLTRWRVHVCVVGGHPISSLVTNKHL